jgi:glycosyltransferase involved in cell wall biosynthesis
MARRQGTKVGLLLEERAPIAMRILCFLPDLDAGGAQRTLINLANAFVEMGGDVQLCAARTDGRAREWIAPGVETVDLAARGTRNSVPALMRLLGSTRPDVLLATMVDANIVAWVASQLVRRQKPCLVLRETNSHLARGDLGWLRGKLIGHAYRKADRVVALSSGVAEELTSLYGLNPSRVVTIPNPVTVSDIAARVMAAKAQPSPVRGGEPFILAIGRLARQKGFDRLIEAFAQMPGEAIRLVIVGEGEERAALTQLAEKLGVAGRVTLAGFVLETERWLAHAAVFALPSRWEGFGHVIVEAMASEVPVVAYDCPYGPRDILRSDVNGILVQEGDVAGLAAALGRVLEQPEFAARLRQTARVDANRYAQPVIAQSYLTLLKQAIAAS